jgi:hypothetical protein
MKNHAPMRHIPWGVNISTAQKFIQYNTTVEDGNGIALYNTSYSTSNGRSNFIVELDVHEICKTDQPLVSGNLTVFIPDADIKDSLMIADHTGNVYRFGMSLSGSTYSLDYFYIFAGNDNATEGRLLVQNKVSFTSKGGWAADSIYFFDNLAFFSATVNSQVAPQ